MNRIDRLQEIVPVQERHPFQQKAASLFDTLGVTPPVLQTKAAVLAQQLKALVGRNVPDSYAA